MLRVSTEPYFLLLENTVIITGLPYTFAGQARLDQVTGCSP
jgi:hypothetical protein